MRNFICVQCGTQFGETVEPPSRCLMQGLAMLFGASRGAWFAACVDARRAFRSGPRVSKPARHRDHRHARHFDGTAGPCIGVQSLGCYRRTRALRRESFCFVLFSRAADVKQAILPAQGCALKTSRQELSASRPLSYESLPIQEARIKPILDRLADFDLFEIGMFGI